MSGKKSLLEMAMEAKVLNRKKTPPINATLQEQVDLALAFLKGDVAPSQVRSATGQGKRTGATQIVSTILLKAYHAGIIEIKKKN